MKPTVIVIPTYNEAPNIARMIPRLRHEVPHAHILVVDDDSPDGTASVVRGFADPAVHLLPNAKKRGLGPAYIAGFRWALARPYQSIVQMDADFSHDPADVARLLGRLGELDVVIGSRYTRGGRTENWSRFREFVSRSGNLYARLVLQLSQRDVTAGFNAWTREALENIDVESVGSKGYGFQVELKYRAVRRGFRVGEVPICFRERVEGVSKMTSKIIAEAMVKLLLVRWRNTTGRSIASPGAKLPLNPSPVLSAEANADTTA